MAFSFEVLTPEKITEYGISYNISTAAVDKTTGWVLYEIPKHWQRYAEGDYAHHFEMVLNGELKLRFSLMQDLYKKDECVYQRWFNLHGFQGWRMMGIETATAFIKEALVVYNTGRAPEHRPVEVIIDCDF